MGGEISAHLENEAMTASVLNASLADIELCPPEAAQAMLEIATMEEMQKPEPDDALMHAFSKAAEYCGLYADDGLPFKKLKTDPNKMYIRSRSNSNVYFSGVDTCTCPHGQKGAAGAICWHRAVALAVLAVGTTRTIHEILEVKTNGEEVEISEEDVEWMKQQSEQMSHA